MASTNKGRFFVSMSSAWAKNERMAEELHAKEGLYEGWQNKPSKRIGPPGKQMEVREDAAVGLDGSDFHYGGEMLTKVKEEATSSGDVNVYFQRASGGTIMFRAEKVGEGRHYIPRQRPRNIKSF